VATTTNDSEVDEVTRSSEIARDEAHARDVDVAAAVAARELELERERAWRRRASRASRRLARERSIRIVLPNAKSVRG